MDRDETVPTVKLNSALRCPHVLLLVGNDLYARTLERSLGRRGWRTTRALPTGDALALWRSSGADVALVELDEDALSGLALLSAAQRLTPPGRAVVVTRDPAATRMSEAVKCRLGIQAVAVRPCHIDALVAALCRALPGEPLRDADQLEAS